MSTVLVEILFVIYPSWSLRMRLVTLPSMKFSHPNRFCSLAMIPLPLDILMCPANLLLPHVYM